MSGLSKNNILKIIRDKIVDWKIHIQTRRTPLRVIVGASNVCERGWIATDIEHLNILNQKDWEKYFHKNSIDAILAEHVWEHLTLEDAYTAAIKCYQYLKRHGYLRVAVPDGFHTSPDYLNAVKPCGTGAGSDDHRVLYNYKTLSHVFETAGFEIKLLEYFDEQGNFHYNEWNPKQGLIHRSKFQDSRNKAGQLNYTSIIIDAVKQ